MASKRRSAGLSLIEVLVAMAIFVIGILAVLRIFPKSIGLIGSNRDRTDAMRLAQLSLAQLRSHESQLPDQIVPAGLPTVTDPTQPNFGLVQFPNGGELIRPDDFGPVTNWTDPNDSAAVYRQAALSRLILGERTVVPRAVSYATTVQPTFTLFGPIDQSTGTPAIEVFREYTAVDPTALTYVTAGARNARPVYAFKEGGVDPFTHLPANDLLLFELDDAARVVIVQFAYLDDNGNVVDSQLPANAGTNNSTLPAAGGNPTSTVASLTLPSPYVIPGSIHIRQPLAHDGAGRYSFDDTSSANGVIRINAGLAGETLSMEYVVQDWRLLGGSYNLTFGAGGQIQNIAPVSGGMLQLTDTNLDPSYQPLVVLLATGQTLPVDAAQWQNNAALANAGQVPLTLNTGLSLDSGPYEVQVWYRKLVNWAMMPAIAPSHYLLYADALALQNAIGAGSTVPQNSVVETQVVNLNGASYAQLLFRPSEAGRTVTVSYESGAASGGRTQVQGEIYVIPPLSNATSSLVAGNPPRHLITLQTPLDPSGALAAGSATDVRPYVHAVEGLSLQVRVVFNDQNFVKSGVTVAGGGTGDSRQRLFELSWLVRRHR
jgi:type II secretory pathway pseudopilin PulG